ncbi:hypothetical protein GEV33_008702 [Tenebrio molitor]|uniref:Uncharacterized protein n=1 Tax=Tenebrio molitor TaxID=7067 RepID=A0A8J6L9W4_TENMO|nr:hypothetical protein GEV33_008702 [Tenebrio molitor]
MTGVVFRVLHSGVAMDGLVAPVTAPCGVWIAQLARGLHRRRPPMPACEPTTHFHTLLVSPQYMGTGIGSQPFVKHTLSGAQELYHCICQRFYHIDGTDIIAQVAQTCYHPVTGYHSRGHTYPHSRTRTSDSCVRFQLPRVTVSPVGLC